MRKFNNEFLQRVKDSTNLIDVIRAYGIDVKKKGSKYWACCPFHHEKTPSFHLKMDFIIVSVAMNQVIPLNS